MELSVDQSYNGFNGLECGSELKWILDMMLVDQNL